jgi:hypothetical protein
MNKSKLKQLIREGLNKHQSRAKFTLDPFSDFGKEQQIAESNNGKIGDMFPTGDQKFNIFFHESGEMLHNVSYNNLLPIKPQLNEGKEDKFKRILEGLDGLVKKAKKDFK